MQKRIIFLFALAVLLSGHSRGLSQQDVAVVAPASEAAEGLDLKAVGELFKDSKNVEEFEKALNDPETGINNLDLDDNGEVDFIRVVEQVSGDTHLLILQVALSKTEFQDVATIEIEKSGDESYQMQVHGNEVIYGADYYVAPAHIHIHTWPIITWMYRPVYRPYHPRWYFGFYPVWWRPYRPVSVHVYHTRTVRFTGRATFQVTRTSRVRSVSRVNYKPRSSTLVKKRTTVTRTKSGGKTTTRVTRTRTTKSGGKSTTVKKGVSRTKNKKTGKTTVRKGAKKTTRTKHGKTTKAKGVKKTRKRKK